MPSLRRSQRVLSIQNRYKRRRRCQGLKANARELANKTFYVQEGSITL
jgi:hypothetical protein